MKFLFTLSCFMLPLFSTAVIDTVYSKSEITDVTVFFNGAEVSRATSLEVKKGKQIIVFDKLPQEINAQSIQVPQIRGCKILSVKHQSDFSMSIKKTAAEQEIEKKIENEERAYKKIRNQFLVYEMEEDLLIRNSDFRGSEGGAKLSEVKEAADYYRIRLNEIRLEMLKLQDEVDRISDRIQEHYLALNEVTVEKRKKYSKILVALESDKVQRTKMNVSYYISSAGWDPMYDFRVESVSMPLTIVYNANVYQSSGEDWNNVNITLSTNNPSLSGSKPEIKKWYINQPSPYALDNSQKNTFGAIKGRVMDASSAEPMPFVNVVIMHQDEFVTGATTDFDGSFSIKPLSASSYVLQTTYVGYESSISYFNITDGQTTHLDVKMNQGSMELEEVVILDQGSNNGNKRKDRMELERLPTRSVNAASAVAPTAAYSDMYGFRGARGNQQQTFIQGMNVKSESDAYAENYIDNSIRTSVANLEYKIEIPYTVPSDGEDYNIKIKEVTKKADYILYAIPKLEAEAFLTARLSNWTELNLLSGVSNIFYQGTYVAESFIDAYQSSDTLEISLGRDRNVVVSREGNKKKNDKIFTGNTVKEKVAWNIAVKNNRKAGIQVKVKDQYPLSEWKSVEVELLESQGAKVNPKSGILTWDLKIEAGSKKELGFMYSLKYNKGANLSFEN